MLLTSACVYRDLVDLLNAEDPRLSTGRVAFHRFSPPVPVKAERAGMAYMVTNVKAASEHLIKWP